MTYRVHKAMGQPVENTLHDLRWGDIDRSGTVKDYVWVFLISGSAPPAHFIGGWGGRSQRAAAGDVFPPRRRHAQGHLQARARSSGRGSSSRRTGCGWTWAAAGVVELPHEETQRRWQATTPQWPIMHAVTYGVSRDQMMARHKANHIQVAYANTAADADRAMLAKAAMADAMGIKVYICGTRKSGKRW